MLSAMQYFCSKSGLVVSVLGVNYTCACEGMEVSFHGLRSLFKFHGYVYIANIIFM